jgi:hypothetical protein
MANGWRVAGIQTYTSGPQFNSFLQSWLMVQVLR